MAEVPSPEGGLSRTAQDRLDRFAAAFERLGANEYVQYATGPGDDTDVGAAREAVDRALGAPAVRAAAKVAVREFVDWAAQAYSRRLPFTDTILLFQSLPDRADDRVRLLQSLERAVIAIILWGDLEPDDRTTLLGPWTEMASAAVEPTEG